MTTALKVGEGSASRPGRSPGKEPLPIELEVGLAGLYRCGKSRSHRNSISGPSTRSQSLYRLSNPGPPHVMIPAPNVVGTVKKYRVSTKVKFELLLLTLKVKNPKYASHHINMCSDRLSLQECFLEPYTLSFKSKCSSSVQTVHLVKYGMLHAFLKLGAKWKRYLASRFDFFEPATNKEGSYNTLQFLLMSLLSPSYYIRSQRYSFHATLVSPWKKPIAWIQFCHRASNLVSPWTKPVEWNQFLHRASNLVSSWTKPVEWNQFLHCAFTLNDTHCLNPVPSSCEKPSFTLNYTRSLKPVSSSCEQHSFTLNETRWTKPVLSSCEQPSFTLNETRWMKPVSSSCEQPSFTLNETRWMKTVSSSCVQPSFTQNEFRCLKPVSSSCEQPKVFSMRTYLSCV